MREELMYIKTIFKSGNFVPGNAFSVVTRLVSFVLSHAETRLIEKGFPDSSVKLRSNNENVFNTQIAACEERSFHNIILAESTGRVEDMFFERLSEGHVRVYSYIPTMSIQSAYKYVEGQIVNVAVALTFEERYVSSLVSPKSIDLSLKIKDWPIAVALI
ncbi:hypothetical protein TNCV_4544841 [Trichonephila clavipes]|nr:hypothetical protein TNCV_4544841 [Trichonephila clavipes]